MKNNLKKLATKGIMWMGISQFSTQFFKFIVTIVLARVLFPEDFGLISLAAIFIGLVLTVHELGFGAAIIQRKEISDEHLSTAFWGSLTAGIVFCFLTIILSPMVADFFQDERVQPILIILSFVFIVGSFIVIPASILSKKLNFKEIALMEVGAETFTGIIAIILAFSGFGVWSLVLRMLLGNLIYGVLLWRVCPWRPSLVFKSDRFKELFGFSANVIGSRLINYGQINIDNLIVGKLLGVTALGYYSFAYRMITFPLKKVSMVIIKVTFPTFSLIQEDNNKLRKGYLNVIRYISVITFPALSGLFVVAPEFIAVFLGEKWLPLILPLQILCIAGAIRSVVDTSNVILLSKGRPDIQLKWDIITFILLTLVVLIGVDYGIVGVAVGVVIVTIFMYAAIQIIANRLINLNSISYLKSIYPATLSSIAMIVFVFLFKEIAYSSIDISKTNVLIGSIVVGLLVYIIFIQLSWRHVITDIKSIYSDVIEREK